MIETRVDAEKLRVYTRVSGTLSFNDLFAHVVEEIQSGAHRYMELFDATGARTDLTGSDVQQLANLAKEPNENPGPIAIVASDPYVFGLAHMYQMLCENYRVVGVFRGIGAAAKWLNAQATDGAGPAMGSRFI